MIDIYSTVGMVLFCLIKVSFIFLYIISMKKNLLFTLMAVFLAGFWFGGVSMASEPLPCTSESAIACIDNAWYATLPEAINNVSDGNNVISIIKSWDYELPGNIEKVVTIKWNTGVVAKIKHSVTKTDDWEISKVVWWTVFENLVFVLTWVAWQDYHHYLASEWKITLKDCTIDWTMYVDSEMEFDNCKFIKEETKGHSNSFNVHVYNNAKFDNCQFINDNSRNVNLWDKGTVALHTVIFDNVSFSNNASDVKKLPVMIHEARDYTAENKKVSQWDVNFLKCTVDWNYNTTGFISDGNLFWIDDILTADWKKEDPLRGSASFWTVKWWDVTVTIDWITVYSTPSYAVAQIWETKYATLPEAINNVSDGNNVISIIKSWDYELPGNIEKVVTIKWNTGVVAKIKHSVTKTDDWEISKVVWWTVFENLVFVLTWVAWQDYHHYLASEWKITLKDCTIDWTMYVDSEMEFDNCKFIKEETKGHSNSFNVHVYNNAKFDNCQFINDNSRNVNLWDKGTVALHTVIFDNVSFSNNASDVKKLPVMIHEARDYTAENKKVSQWDVNFLKCTVDWNYNTTGFISDGNLFWIDDILTADWKKEDPLRGSASSWTVKWWDVTVTVNWVKVYSTPKKNTTYGVTFDWTWKVEVNDWFKVSKPTDPTKNCNKFDGWYVWNDKYDFNAVVTSNLALVSKWTYTCSSSSSSSGGGSGGGSSSSSKTTTTTDTKKAEETKTENKTSEEIELKWEVTEEQTSEKVDETATPDNGYSKEFNDAYSFAHKNWITTMDSIEKADMNAPLTRIAMAKMLSQYAINVLGRTPDTTKVVPAFPDVSAELDAAYNSWVTLAYQLGIMWINIDKFRPDDLVTRAEFGTALSRMLYSTADWEIAYYETHLAKLMEEKIITVDTPDLQELRGYVMIMLMRSANK